MDEDLKQFVPDVQFEQIPIKNLVSNQEYQRNLSIKHVNRAVEHFDLCQVNPVKVSRRDGVNYVFNGQHTIEIIALISHSRETPVWCMVYENLEYEHEADIFANQMKYVKPLLPYEIFMANIEADSDKHIMIKDLVESYNLAITPTSAPNGICAVATLERIFDRYGYQTLDRVLRLLIGAWEGSPQSFSSNMLSGVARIVNAYGDELDDNTFKEKIGQCSVKEIARNAKDRRPGSAGFSEALLLVYNRNKRNNVLQFDKLYSHKIQKKDEPFQTALKQLELNRNQK